MDDIKFLKNIESEYEKLSSPYGLDHQKVEKLITEVNKWMGKPDNDCLRSRGDYRWILACDLCAKLQSLLQPY